MRTRLILTRHVLNTLKVRESGRCKTLSVAEKQVTIFCWCSRKAIWKLTVVEGVCNRLGGTTHKRQTRKTRNHFGTRALMLYRFLKARKVHNLHNLKKNECL
jgi:3'-phosphoadenosine 5'-phosphosulfate (PAPS) 3'-phosphatase